MGLLTAPHQILSWLDGSSTMNLSSGDRPVCLPVRTTSGPSAAMRPSPWRMASSYSSAVDRLARTCRPRAGVFVGAVVAICGGLPGAGDHADRPAARDACPKARRSRLPQSYVGGCYHVAGWLRPVRSVATFAAGSARPEGLKHALTD